MEACNLKQELEKFSGKYYKDTWTILGPWKTKKFLLALCNLDPGSRYRMAQIGRNLGRPTVQSPAQNRISSEVRPGCSGFNPLGSQILRAIFHSLSGQTFPMLDFPHSENQSRFSSWLLSLVPPITRIKNLTSQFPLSRYQKVTFRSPEAFLTQEWTSPPTSAPPHTAIAQTQWRWWLTSQTQNSILDTKHRVKIHHLHLLHSCYHSPRCYYSSSLPEHTAVSYLAFCPLLWMAACPQAYGLYSPVWWHSQN